MPKGTDPGTVPIPQYRVNKTKQHTHRKNLREETSLWDNLLRSYLCPVSRLCRHVSIGLTIIAPSRGVESPVPTCVHTLVWTAADECCQNPRKKKIWSRLVRTNPIPVDLLRDWKRGCFRCEVRSVFAGKKRMGQRGQRERVSLYFSTSCLFSCVRIGCQRWYQVHVGGVFN